MQLFIRRQIWALIHRYLITVRRSPKRSFIRILLWPGFLVGSCIHFLVTNKDNIDNFGFEKSLPLITLLMTAFHVYHFSELLVLDKENGFKSLMISMGLKRISYFLGNSLCFIICVLPLLIILAIVLMIYVFKDLPVATFLLFTLFVIHLTGSIFVFTSFITSTSFTSIVIILLILENLTHVGVLWIMSNSNEFMWPFILFIGSASPYESVRIFCDTYTLCRNCETTKFSNYMVAQPIYLILLAMTFWSIVFFAFARWFEEVCPWQPDTAIRGPFFCCESITKFDNEITHDEVEPFQRRSENFEQIMTNHEVGIRINNLTKKFKTIPVVNNISFNVYKGETTLLLGHNGAGKTTLMNMILGKLTPDNGKVIIKHSNSIVDNFGFSGLGVCPQTSILDNNLNVKQHLELFARLKSSAMSAASQENHINTTIEDVSLTEHMHKCPSELSGGMKRKLSLAIAFVGKSSILLLDEPSSGLDPDSRVFIWNLIRRYRADRTVLLSTQHMEEADYLGDRIAIMSEGKIICCGSSSFLNNIFGTGYKLRVECHASKKKQILAFVRKYFETAKPSETDQVVETTYDLESKKDPLQDVIIELTGDKSKDLEMKMIEMLEEIETNFDALHIKSYGLKSSSIEDVLLNTSKLFSSELKESVKLTLTSTSGHVSTLASPLRAPDTRFFASQKLFLYAFMIKHLQTYKRDWKSIIYYRGLVTTLCLWSTIRDLDDIVNAPHQHYRANIKTGFLILHLIYYPTMERVSKFKVIQLTSYGNFLVYWLSQLIADLMSIFLLVFSFNLIFPFAYHGDFGVSKVVVHILATISIILFGISAALFAYVLSTILTDANTSIGYHFFLHGTSVFVALIISFVGLWKNLSWLQDIFDQFFIAVLPTDAFDYILYGLSSKCYIESHVVECIVSTNLSPVIFGIISLCIQIIVYSIILYFIEHNTIDLSGSIRNILYKKSPLRPREEREIDKDVIDESIKAIRLIENVTCGTYSLVAADLNKSYVKGVKAVDQLSFTVNRGECFGLLGVNGAGKSTTFSMIATETKPDSGRIWMNGHYSNENVDKYRHKLGYDPQSNPEMSLCPTDAFYLMARLRRVNEQSIKMLVNSLLELLDMQEHASKAVRDLSGGTKRKLALGMSLIGNPSLLALDEPTAGVDPIARRSIWHLLKSLRKQNGASIIISSHAMEECEAICDRISIMARGRLRCIGTFLHLRSKFSQGCSVKVQFGNDNRGINKITTSIVADLRQRLISDIGSSVKLADTNVNSATFNVSDNSIKRSSLFKILREFKQAYPNMNYIVNDFSLEDIFIALAREQQQLEQATNVST